jgi:hypothetical protein
MNSVASEFFIPIEFSNTGSRHMCRHSLGAYILLYSLPLAYSFPH